MLTKPFSSGYCQAVRWSGFIRAGGLIGDLDAYRALATPRVMAVSVSATPLP